ncbi:MAG: ChaN family lipoprotein [Bdellovibrionales bacterium]
MTKKWLDTRRSYLQKLKSQSGLITGLDDSVITDYARSNVDLYKRVWFKDSEEDFFKYCEEKKVILCGDFHSSPAVKRFYVRLFKKHVEQLKGSSIMALECFEQKDDPLFQKWLAGEIKDEQLLESSGWDTNWGFSWKSYKRFILKLHKFGFEIRCVNSLENGFDKRDRVLAENLKALSDKGKKVFCLIGQHHLGPENLPKKIEDVFGSKEAVCLHLDSEEIYFALEEYNLLKEVQILSLENHFCFLSTPPWVHWQNHLLHLDELYEGGVDDDEEEDEGDEELRGEDFNAVVFDYVQLLRKDLAIPEELKPIDVAFIDEYVVDGMSERNLYEIMAPLLDSETSFYWPEQFEGIMVQGSLNQAAAVAGKYLHVSLMGSKELPWGDTESFEIWCWLEAIGHMLSKFINPKRSTVNRHNLSAFLSARLGHEEGTKLLKTLVKGRILELDQGVKLGNPVGLTWSEIVYASRLKGALVGESLFDLYSKGRISSETLRTYLSVPIDDKKRFGEFYNLILQRLEISI